MEKGLSIAQSRARWADIAAYIKVGSGRTIRDAMRHFGVSYHTILDACSVHDATPPRANARTELPPRVRKFAVSTLEIIGELQNTPKTYKEIGDERGISKQAVFDVAQRAIKAGIRLPSRSDKRKEQETKHD